MATEPYTISTAFSDGVLDNKLHAACVADATVSPKFSGVKTDRGADVCEIHSTSAYTAPEKTALDAIIAAHDGSVIVVTAKTTLSPPAAVCESPSAEEFPVLVTETLPTLLPYRFPTPSARGPPGATVLS